MSGDSKKTPFKSTQSPSFWILWLQCTCCWGILSEKSSTHNPNDLIQPFPSLPRSHVCFFGKFPCQLIWFQGVEPPKVYKMHRGWTVETQLLQQQQLDTQQFPATFTPQSTPLFQEGASLAPSKFFNFNRHLRGLKFGHFGRVHSLQ